MRCGIGLLLIGLGCTQQRVAPAASHPVAPQQPPQALAVHEDWPPPLVFSYTPHANEDAYVARQYAALDAELGESFDFASRGRVRFHWVKIPRSRPATPCDPEQAHRALLPAPRDVLRQGNEYVMRIDALSARQPSPRWMVQLAARRASVYESVWLALREAPSPFTAAQRKIIEQMRTSGRDELVDLADDVEAKAKPATDAIRTAAEEAIGSYAWTLAFAAKTNVHDFDDAVRARLAAFSASSEIIVNAPPPPGMARSDMRLTMKDIPNLR